MWRITWALFRAMRPKQWVKNSFCLAPLIFAQRALNLEAVEQALYVFVGFSLVASTVYLLNDIVDRERDRVHPVKRDRPIAAGLISVPVAAAAGGLIGIGAFLLGWRQSFAVGAVLTGYFVMNVGYSFWLKRLVLVDLFVIAIGFVLRVYAGAAAIGVAASQWILTCTLFIALLMAACKRRSEVELQGPESETRRVLSHYSLHYLDLVVAVVAGVTILSYALYTMSPLTVSHLGTENLIYTLPFVAFAVLRYVFLVLEKSQGENPFDLIVQDGAMIVNIVGYVVVTLLLLYVQ
jgi:4-hydroxybenzoate polyprenyltransferase